MASRRKPSVHAADAGSSGRRREFSMVPIDPGAWEMAVEMLRLSPMQANIVAMLVQQADEREIAAELGLTRETVRVYLMDIYRHTGIERRGDLVGVIRSM